MPVSRLILGLGNPGPEYEATRHNIGFMALDAIADHCRTGGWKKKFKSLVAMPAQGDFLLMKPQTYMNNSGEAAGEALRFHKLAPKDVIVFHDDLDLQPGQVKIKQGGGAAGHNGLKSIDTHIGPDYWRVRLGIGHPGTKEEVLHYVLGAFAKFDEKWLTPLMKSLADSFDFLADGKPAEYLNRIAHRQEP